MNRIRIGKDFKIRWSIKDNATGVAYDLENRNLILYLNTPRERVTISDYTISGNLIEWTFKGKDQKQIGLYSLVLIENNGEIGMCTVDTVNAFALVAHSHEEQLTSVDNVSIDAIELDGTISIAPHVALSDWSINEEGYGYVKNRTHYEGVVKTITKAGDYEFEDKALKVVYHGPNGDVEYNLVHGSSENLSEEPLVVISYCNQVLTVTDQSGNWVEAYPIYVYGALKKLDEKFIPGTIARSKDLEVRPVTYSELVSLRNGAALVAGHFYRITDYVTTTSQENTQSAGHQFDVIVLALTNDTLSERAWACHHEGDTYFQNSHLEAWQIWYCLDNDTSRFTWADTANGKGVIYRMIDEFNNDCPYDFKNIQFKHPHNSVDYPGYYYTFHYSSGSSNQDLSILQTHACSDNSISPYEYLSTKVVVLNEIVFLSKSTGDFTGNSFKQNCHKISFLDSAISNSFEVDCFNNEFKGDCISNTFKYAVRDNTFGSSLRYCLIGANCQSNVFGSSCYSITLGANCYSNKFGNSCRNIILGNNSSNNEFGDNCRFNTLGQSCQYNILSNNCRYCSFGNGCNHISINIPYCYYINISEGAQYIEFTNAETASANQLVKGYRIGNVQGTSSSLLQIAVERNRAYETTVAIDSAGNVKQFCIADIIL